LKAGTTLSALLLPVAASADDVATPETTETAPSDGAGETTTPPPSGDAGGAMNHSILGVSPAA